LKFRRPVNRFGLEPRASDELAVGAVPVAKAVRYALAEDIVGRAGREAGDVCI
jgi:hypothetical protein